MDMKNHPQQEQQSEDRKTSPSSTAAIEAQQAFREELARYDAARNADFAKYRSSRQGDAGGLYTALF